MDLDEVITELYGLHPRGFVQARDAYAARARQEKQAEAAASKAREAEQGGADRGDVGIFLEEPGGSIEAPRRRVRSDRIGPGTDERPLGDGALAWQALSGRGAVPTIPQVRMYTKEYGARSAPWRAGMPVYEMLRSSLPEFFGGLGAAIVIALWDRFNRWRRDRRSRQGENRSAD
ncbi:hypothetical protein ACWCQL_30930 [Streptomyces sp. NPDC002073]